MSIDIDKKLEKIETSQSIKKTLYRGWWLWFVLAFPMFMVAIVGLASVENPQSYTLYDWFDGKIANLTIGTAFCINGFLAYKRKPLYIKWQLVALVVFIVFIAKLQGV